MSPDSKELRRQLRIDRLIALRDCLRMKKVMEEGEALSAEGPLPAYAEQAYADALLYGCRLEEACASAFSAAT